MGTVMDLRTRPSRKGRTMSDEATVTFRQDVLTYGVEFYETLRRRRDFSDSDLGHERNHDCFDTDPVDD
jgi:hypothetical protein